jgi:hypothetical protein
MGVAPPLRLVVGEGIAPAASSQLLACLHKSPPDRMTCFSADPLVTRNFPLDDRLTHRLSTGGPIQFVGFKALGRTVR